jgi:threonine synthase
MSQQMLLLEVSCPNCDAILTEGQKVHLDVYFKEINRDRVSVVLATASPAKFPDVIRAAIGREPTHPSLEALKSRSVDKPPVKADPAAIKAFIDRHGV